MTGTPEKAKKLILTCDTEALPEEAAGDHVNRLIWGRGVGAPHDAGIGLMMDIAEEFGARITFFLDAVERLKYGAQIDEAGRAIAARGHGLELHLHLELVGEEFWNERGFSKPTWALNFFNDDAARILMGYGAEALAKMGGDPPCAFRAGAFRYNQSILRAMDALGIRLSFQYYPTTATKATFPHGPDAGILPVFRWGNGVIEVPVGCLETPHPRKKMPRYTGFESHKMFSLSDYAEAMRRFWAMGPEHNVLVLVMHSWSFLAKDENGHFAWKDDRLVKAFRDFLASLPGDVEVITARDLLGEMERGNIKPAFDVPTAFAGTEAIPLYLKSNASAGSKVEKTVQDVLAAYGDGNRMLIPEVLETLGVTAFGTAIPSKMRLYAKSFQDLYALEFWFPVPDPVPGQIAGLKRIYPTVAGKAYRLMLEFFDGYEPSHYPNRIHQKVSVDGEIIDTHDISYPAFTGWRPIEHVFVARGPQAEICAFQEVAGPLEPWNWGYTAKAMVRGMELVPV